MSSLPYIERAAANAEAAIVAYANIANGYNYDWTAAQVLELKQDLDTSSIVSAGVPTASVYWSEFDQRQQGDEANYSQVEVTAHFHVDICVAIQTNFRKEITLALADIEKALTKDISLPIPGVPNSSTAINLFVLGATAFALNSNGTADASLHFDVVIRHAANDPSTEYQTTYN